MHVYVIGAAADGLPTEEELDFADRVNVTLILGAHDFSEFEAFCRQSDRQDQRWYTMILRTVLSRSDAPEHKEDIIDYLLDRIVTDIDDPRDGRGSLLTTALQCRDYLPQPPRRLANLIGKLIRKGASPLYQDLRRLDVYDRAFGPRGSEFGCAHFEQDGFRPGIVARMLLSWKSDSLKYLARAAFRRAVKVRNMELGDCCTSEEVPDLVNLLIAARNNIYQLPATVQAFVLDDPDLIETVEEQVKLGRLGRRYIKKTIANRLKVLHRLRLTHNHTPAQ